LTCSSGRIDPSACQCDTNSYESGGECVSCHSGYFYSTLISQCALCDSNCKSCSTSSTTCTECYDNLFLYNSQCLCSDSTLSKI